MDEKKLKKREYNQKYFQKKRLARNQENQVVNKTEEYIGRGEEVTVPVEEEEFLSDLMNKENIKMVIQEKEPKEKVDVHAKDTKLNEDILQAQEDMNYYMSLFEADKKKKKQTGGKSKHLEEDDGHGIYSSNPTTVLGKDRRLLLNKIQQYKNLFPEELKDFKIKKTPTVQELQEYLDEIDCILSTSNADTFITDSILSAIKIIEGASAYTKNYNITGLADMLKVNKQFHRLSKQIYLKYGIFEQAPPEFQLLVIIVTTAYICKNKNSGKAEIEKYLNEPVNNKTI